MKPVAALLLMISLATVGCGPSVLPPEKIEPEVVKAKETVWTVMADRLDKGRYPNSTILELTVKVLREDGHITDNEVDAFYAAFPGVKEKERELTSADAKALRSIHP